MWLAGVTMASMGALLAAVIAGWDRRPGWRKSAAVLLAVVMCLAMIVMLICEPTQTSQPRPRGRAELPGQ